MPTRENSPIDFLPERIAMRFLPDRFTLTLIATVLLASFLPARGEFVGWLNVLTIAAIALLFFMHGAKLSREAILAGSNNWRLHLWVMFSTFIILSIINPYQVEDEPELKLNKLHEDQSFFEMLGEYILAGFKIAMIIAAMLIGFIALISAVNALFSAVLGISFQQILGYVFYPLAWLIGIPAEEALKAGSIMATKLVANEFVAMIELKKIAAELSPRGLGILSVFLVSFANFASIGIVAGAIKGLNEQQGNVVSRFGLKLVYGSTLVSLLSAAIAGLVL